MVSPDNNKRISSRQKAQNLFLGVDGGGTKTKAVLIDENRNLLAQADAGASNPVRVGIENAVSNISTAISLACDKIRQNPSKISAATLGLAGVKREDLQLRISERITETLKIESVSVVTDAEIALFGAVKDKFGLVLIAGTGSVCLGKNALGQTYSSGGWGPLAGDEGGAARIAREALRAIAKASDGRGPKTKMTAKALEYFRAGRPEDLVFAIYAPQIDNQKIAGFAKFVFEAAKEGDRAALKIMNNAGKELGLAAIAVIKKLKLRGSKFPIAKVGGVFKAEALVTNKLLETVRKYAPDSYLIEPIVLPAEAAANMAAISFDQKAG